MPQTTLATILVPTASYNTTKRSANIIKAGLGVGVSISCSIRAWCLRFYVAVKEMPLPIQRRGLREQIQLHYNVKHRWRVEKGLVV